MARLVMSYIMSEIVQPVLEFIKNNLSKLHKLLSFILPFVCILAGQYAYKQRQSISIGIELLIPLIIWLLQLIILIVIKLTSSKEKQSIPVPKKRFTKRAPNGDMLFKIEDIYEIELYLGELEDYLESSGLFKN